MTFADKDFVHISDVRALARMMAETIVLEKALGRAEEPVPYRGPAHRGADAARPARMVRHERLDLSHGSGLAT